jgi:hypothetical protein
VLLRSFAIAAFVVASLVVGAVDATANHAWSTYHWARTANPFTLQLGDNMTASWDAHLTTTAFDWGRSDSFTLPNGDPVNASNNPLRIALVAGTAKGRCQPTSGTVQACNAKYGSNGWLGLAQIWLSNGHIVQGTAKMNDTYFDLAKYNNPNEKLHVVCQEIGHTFGLGHTSEDGTTQNTCMDYFSNTGTNAGSTLSTHPNQHDYDQLAAIYAHTDTYNSFTAAGAAAPSKPFAAPGFAPDGTPVGASPSRGRVYITDLPGGVRVVTHITWAD